MVVDRVSEVEGRERRVSEVREWRWRKARRELRGEVAGGMKGAGELKREFSAAMRAGGEAVVEDEAGWELDVNYGGRVISNR